MAGQQTRYEPTRQAEPVPQTEHEQTRAALATTTFTSPAGLLHEFSSRAYQSQQGSWPDDVALHRDPISSRGRQAVSVPARLTLDQELGFWPTESKRNLQRAQDIWDSIPMGETAGTLVLLGASAVVIGGVVLLAARLNPFVNLAVVLLSAIARSLRVPVTVVATSAGFIQLSQGFELASGANGNQNDIFEARELIKNGILTLAATLGAQKLLGPEPPTNPVEMGELATSNVLTTIDVPAHGWLQPIALATKVPFATDITRAHLSPLARQAQDISALTQSDLEEWALLQQVGPIRGFSQSGERAVEASNLRTAKGSSAQTKKPAMSVTVPGVGNVWLETSALRRDICQELVRRETWPFKDMERFLTERSQPPGTLLAQMRYLQAELRLAKDSSGKNGVPVDVGQIVRKSDSYQFERPGLRPVMIDGVQWWFKVSPEDHKLLNQLFSSRPPVLYRRDINDHAVKRIKVALEKARLRDDPEAPTKVLGKIHIIKIGIGISESYYRFVPEPEQPKPTGYDHMSHFHHLDPPDKSPSREDEPY